MNVTRQAIGLLGLPFVSDVEAAYRRRDRSALATAEQRVIDRAPFAAAMCRWEQEWSHRHEVFPTRPRGDALAVAQRLYSKYRRRLEQLR